jgi:hypothetical protein
MQFKVITRRRRRRRRRRRGTNDQNAAQVKFVREMFVFLTTQPATERERARCLWAFLNPYIACLQQTCCVSKGSHAPRGRRVVYRT